MGGLQIGEKVERVDGRKLRYEDFVERYLKGNRPVVLTGLMDAWRACSDWVTPDGRPNLPFFAHRFGKSLVQVHLIIIIMSNPSSPLSCSLLFSWFISFSPSFSLKKKKTEKKNLYPLGLDRLCFLGILDI